MTTTSLTTLPSLSENSLQAYLRQIAVYPRLSTEEERSLVEAHQQHGDLNAARQLVLSHLRFVVFMAKRYQGYGLALADLIQEGNIGLMKAVKHFDLSHGVRLVTFASHWIKSEICDYVVRNWRIVKAATTKAQRKLFFNLRKKQQRLGWMNQDDTQRMADELSVRPQDVRDMELRMRSQDESFDPLPDAENQRPDLANRFADERDNPLHVLSSNERAKRGPELLQQGLSQLDERSRDILQRRWLNDDKKPRLQDLANEYGVSAERIRQIEQKAMRTLKGTLQSEWAHL